MGYINKKSGPAEAVSVIQRPRHKKSNMAADAIKDVLVEKGKVPEKFHNYPGAVALRKKFGKDPQWEKFFNDLEIDPGTMDIKMDHKLFRNNKGVYTFSAKHNGTNIFSGDYEDRNGNKGVSGLTYTNHDEIKKQLKRKGKRLFNIPNSPKELTEAELFIKQFPGSRSAKQLEMIEKKYNQMTQDYIFARPNYQQLKSFITLFNLQLGGAYWTNPIHEQEKDVWDEKWVDSCGVVSLGQDGGSDLVLFYNKSRAELANWCRVGMHMPFLAFEDC